MGRPKALLEYEGETFLDRHIRLYSELGGRVICVLGDEAERVARSLRRATNAVLVLNPAPERGQFSSLQCGLRAAEGAAGPLLFTPADSPGVLRPTVEALLRAFDAGRADFVQPSYQGRHGHPVVLGQAAARALLALPAEASAREAMRASARRVFVEVEDARVVLDIDTPVDYARLVAERLS